MINLEDVQRIEENRKQIKKELYMKIYEQFSTKIRQSAEYGHKQIFLRIPTYVMGYPAFDRPQAALYIDRQLRRSGFTTQRVSEIDIYVSWFIPKTKKPTKDEDEIDDIELPSFANLRKAANKYR
jgi:hypothetical protein